MKKIFSYISIVFILVQLFAPFSVGINNHKINLNRKKVIAAVDDWSFTSNARGQKITSQKTSYENCAKERKTLIDSLGGNYYDIGICVSESGQVAPGGEEVPTPNPGDTDYYFTTTEARAGQINSKPTTKEICEAERSKMIDNLKSVGSNGTVSECKSKKVTQQITENEQTERDKDKKINPDSNTGFPPCGIGSGEKILGCVAQGTYYLLFKPTSKIFALSGKMLDFVFAYSISDTSYRSAFVTEGWGIVRDFCNMFFIFVLLYVAFKTIFDMNGAKTKETIIYVVIIGILINFSLFATKVIIDTSNVLAKVFYNQNTISITQGDSKANELGEFGEIKLSEAIISKVDPQVIITRANDVNNIPTRTVNETTEGTDEQGNIIYSNESLDVGNFIVVIILSIIINIIGIIVFASCAFMFVVRVVGLWLAMIVVPFAFFTYTVPELQSIEMVGWKHWWPDTLKMAFMAPIFAFFMYIIVGFADKGLGVIESSIRGEKMGLGLVITILIPFIFLMVLLNKAKDITKTLSGNIGKMATEYGSKISKMALGAGGLVAGGAMGLGAGVLRNTVGSLGNNIAHNEKLKANEAKGGFKGFVAKNLRNIGSSAATGSMDIRGIKIGGKQLSQVSIGGKSMESFGFKPGKAKDTSFSKKKEEKIQKRTKRMKELELGESSEEKQKLNAEKNKQKKLQNMAFEEIATLDKLTEIARQKLNDISSQYGAGSNEAKTAGMNLQNLKNKKSALMKGEQYDGDFVEKEVEKTRMVEEKYKEREPRFKGDLEGKEVEKTRMVEEKYKEKEWVKEELTEEKKKEYDYSKYKIDDKSLIDLDKSIRELNNEIVKENNDRREAYAENITSGVTQVVNFITTGHTQGKAEQEAANKIISNIEEAKK